MATNIEFASPDENNNNETTTPWATPKAGNYEDLVLKPEYAARRLKFQVGQTWMRIVPALKTSVHGWMMPIHSLDYEGGRFAHPKTHRRNAKSVFDHAYIWTKQNHPEGLYSKANKAGIRLLSDPMCLFWAIVVEDGKKPLARLFLGSGYDASRGGVPGLGFQVYKMSREHDENGNLVTDAVHPKNGVLVCVEKTKSQSAKYPNYKLRLGRQTTPVDSLLEKMDPEEVAALCPLENVVRELSSEEEWGCLAKVMAPETVALIRASLKTAV
ncbi:MAG: hypothetical protein WCO94_16690 [Verrucomicrobiota bacterium]